MKKTISYSLFWCGKDDHALLYSNGLRAICRAHHTLFPGWEWRVHHDGTLNRCQKASVLLRYEQAGLVKLVDVGAESAICRAMLWRMIPIWDESISHTICRDLDSLLTPRDAVATRQFVDSGAALHALCDNPQHGAPIMGGLCGFRNPLFKAITGMETFDSMVSGFKLNQHGDDQILLMDRVWPALQNNLCEHRISGRSCSELARRSYSSINIGPIEGVPDFVMQKGDSLIPYMGVAGFDYAMAEDFYNQNGVPDVIDRIRRAEVSGMVV